MRLKKFLYVALVTVVWAAPAAQAGESYDVKIGNGTLRGVSDGHVAIFRGIPYAAPPVGALRWMPPQPAPDWRDPRSAVENGPACPQPVNADGSPNGGGVTGPTNEDCLTVNVFAPAKAHKAPVLVWLYGGANNYGANSLPAYDGTSFARDGVILVAVNYRLGGLGFFAHPALTRAADPKQPLVNYGLMDQIAALQWVQRNIAAFGGDPHNVTVGGQSAGGADTLSLMVIPSASGLFQKAIVQSPGNGAPRPMEQAEQRGVQGVERLGLGADATSEQLRAIPADKIIADTRLSAGRTIDGRLMIESVEEGFARGHAAKIPLLIGWNSFDMSMFGGIWKSDKSTGEKLLSDVPESVMKLYADLDWPDKLYAVVNDEFGALARWTAAQASSGAPSWLYYFSYERAALKLQYPGAPHGAEIPFAFDSWDKLQPNMADEFPPPDDADRAVTEIIHSCWVTFIKKGRPECTHAPAWPAYSSKTDQMMELSGKPQVLTNFKKKQFDALDKIKSDAPAAKESK